jgi:hypothetical protein
MNRTGPFQPSDRQFSPLIPQAFYELPRMLRRAPGGRRAIAGAIVAFVASPWPAEAGGAVRGQARQEQDQCKLSKIFTKYLTGN